MKELEMHLQKKGRSFSPFFILKKKYFSLHATMLEGAMVVQDGSLFGLNSSIS